MQQLVIECLLVARQPAFGSSACSGVQAAVHMIRHVDMCSTNYKYACRAVV